MAIFNEDTRVKMKKGLGFCFLILISVLLFSNSLSESFSLENQKVTVTYTFSSEVAQIGKPFTVYYKIAGGSGKYSDIYWEMTEITEHCGINDNFQGSELSEANGSFTFIPESGETIDVNVSCTDQETGISWNENYEEIECLPNHEIPISIDIISSAI